MLDNIFSVALQIGMVICLCGFIYMIVSLMFKDVLKKKKPAADKAKEEVALVIVNAGNESMINKKIHFSGRITIGRAAGNIVVLDDKFASHHHAIITRVHNLYEIEDLNSKNHTYVNDEILNGKQFLKNGDIIKIGGVTFRFER